MPRKTKQQIIEELEHQIDIHLGEYRKLSDKYQEVLNKENIVHRDSKEYLDLTIYKSLYQDERKRSKGLENQVELLVSMVEQLKEENQKLNSDRKHNARGAGRKPTVTQEQKEEVKSLYATGHYSMDKICKKVGLSKGTVFKIIRDK